MPMSSLGDAAGTVIDKVTRDTRASGELVPPAPRRRTFFQPHGIKYGLSLFRTLLSGGKHLQRGHASGSDGGSPAHAAAARQKDSEASALTVILAFCQVLSSANYLTSTHM